MPDFTKAERDSLLARAFALDARIHPPANQPAPRGRAMSLLREEYYQVLGEYADRLPRVVMGACPFGGEPLRRSFDPFGLDGPWWCADREVPIEEPAPPETFRVLLGALSFFGREPAEARDPVLPGPEAPFVVPRLLSLPGMVAVVSRLPLETGDVAFPIAYFSPDPIPPRRLHQEWRERDLWFTTPEGKSGWIIANDPFDFDLGPWVRTGQLRWIEPDDPDFRVVDGRDGRACPFADLPGDRAPQAVAGGARELLPLPDGVLINPFDEA